MFDDYESWDGLSGLGAVMMIGGWGVVAYLAYAFGFQNGLNATQPCIGPQSNCIIETKSGWFGIQYKEVKTRPAASEKKF